MLFYDFIVIYAAGVILQAQGNPYDYAQFQSALTLTGLPADRILPPFPYPPWTLWVFYFVGLFNFTTSLTLFSIAYLGAVILYAEVTGVVLVERPLWLTRTKLLLCAALFVPFLKGILFSQTTWLPITGLACSIILMEKRSLYWAGVILSLTLIKPHLWIPLYGFLFGLAIFKKQRLLLVGLATGGILQLALSYTIFPYDLHFFLTRIFFSPHGNADTQIITASIPNILSSYTGWSFVKVLGMGIGFFYGLKRAYTSDKESVTKLILFNLVPIGILCAPYSWSHDYLPLFPFLLQQAIYFTKKAGEQNFLRLWGGSALFLCLLLQFNQEMFFIILLTPVIIEAFIKKNSLKRT